jgi:hypothetical protein
MDTNNSVHCAKRNGSFHADRLPMEACYQCTIATCVVRQIIAEEADRLRPPRSRPEARPQDYRPRRRRVYAPHE